MREIKFRIWDKKEKYMETFELDNDFDCEIDWLDNRILMQFTGLKDKNNKEIYEGDIIIRQRWSKGEKGGQYIREVKWRDTNSNHGYGIRAIETTEVIGNIYENPELI